jgi:L-ribulose-5-phosphate 3-epimerase UlaE
VNVRDIIRETLLGEAFLLTQPDRGDVFSWLDDHADELAEAIDHALAKQVSQ